jgi:hypothetical protein
MFETINAYPNEPRARFTSHESFEEYDNVEEPMTNFMIPSYFNTPQQRKTAGRTQNQIDPTQMTPTTIYTNASGANQSVYSSPIAFQMGQQ